MDRGTQSYDDSHADEITDRCESVAGGIASFFPFAFKAREKVRDIGAGSGRDAAAMLALSVPLPWFLRRVRRGHPASLEGCAGLAGAGGLTRFRASDYYTLHV